jgi:hypothetical protein
MQLAYEAYKAKRIIASRDISYAFTNVMANNYYSLSEHYRSFFLIHVSDIEIQGHMITSVSLTISPILPRGWMTLLSSSSSHSRVCRNWSFCTSTALISVTGWKRLLLADGPRQTINALTLYAFYLSKQGKGEWWDISKYFQGNDLITTALTISTAFTCLVFAGSVLLLLAAGICYIPLLCHIQGNLKVSLDLRIQQNETDPVS